MRRYTAEIVGFLSNIANFSECVTHLRLRGYQIEVAQAICDSVVNHRGDTIVVMYPRQSGKNEVQARLEAYLLTLFSQMPAEMVKVSPTFKPQTQNAMRRLERVLKRNLVTQSIGWKKETGYIYRVGDARIFFLSGGPTSNVVGATANALLECDEAQDIIPAKWDKDFAPMAASTNATRVFWGTAWTSKTLLARELRAARQAEIRTGRRLAFVITADDVRKEVPAYGAFVDGQIARLGRNHPMVRTQFFSEEIDSEAGMFPASRLALMQGTHAPLTAPRAGYAYAILVDVAGEDEGIISGDGEEMSNKGRDSTALTVVEVDLETLADELIKAPLYLVIHRQEWVGIKHTLLYGQIKALAEHWGARYLVIDATGVGAGLTSFLDKALPGRVIPFVFSQKSKSDLGWSFLAVVETGRYKEYACPRGNSAECLRLQQVFWQQAEACQSQILEGPGKIMRWSVPDGYRDPVTGELVHDDLLISASLVSILDSQSWGLARSSQVAAPDLFETMHEAY